MIPIVASAVGCVHVVQRATTDECTLEDSALVAMSQERGAARVMVLHMMMRGTLVVVMRPPLAPEKATIHAFSGYKCREHIETQLDQEEAELLSSTFDAALLHEGRLDEPVDHGWICELTIFRDGVREKTFHRTGGGRIEDPSLMACEAMVRASGVQGFALR